jgi:O-antigen/teichoic acid export membrane protein
MIKTFLNKISKNIFIRNSLILFIGTFVVNILGYLFHVVVGRLVSPHEYGEIESLLAILSIILVPALAITTIATKYAARMKRDNNIMGTEILSLYLNKKILFFGTILFLVALGTTPWVQRFLKIESSLPVIFLWVIMFFSFLNAVSIGILTGWQKFNSVNKVNIAITTLKLVTAVLFIFTGFVVSGVIGGLTLAIIIGWVISHFFIRKFFHKQQTLTTQSIENELFPFSSLKQYVIPAFLGTLSIAILGNVDMVFARHHLSGADSGVYGALTIVAKTIFFVTGVLTTVLFAMSSEKGDIKQDGSRKIFYLASSLTALVVAVAIFIFWLFPESIMKVFFGQIYVESSHFLIWFALAAGLYAFSSLFLHYLLSIYQIRAMKYFLALSSLEIATLFFFGQDFYAIIGIAIATQLLAISLGIFFIIRGSSYAKETAFYSYPSL